MNIFDEIRSELVHMLVKLCQVQSIVIRYEFLGHRAKKLSINFQIRHEIPDITAKYADLELVGKT